LEKQVCRDGSKPGKAAERIAGGKPKAKGNVCGPGP